LNSSSFQEPGSVSYFKILLTYADTQDRICIIFGVLSACLCGLGLPSFVFLFGDICDAFEPRNPPEETLSAISKIAKTLSLIGVLVWLFSYLFFTFLIMASERIG
jgi:hypothetical protein